MDADSGGQLRVTGAPSADAALSAAMTSAPTLLPWWDEKMSLVVADEGWYRCQPCVCGDGHRYDIWPTSPHARGSAYTYLLAVRYEPA